MNIHMKYNGFVEEKYKVKCKACDIHMKYNGFVEEKYKVKSKACEHSHEVQWIC